MKQLPTGAAQPHDADAAHALARLQADSQDASPAVRRALTALQAAALDGEPAVAECLTALAELVVRTGDPDAVFSWARTIFGLEDLRVLAAQHRIRLHETRAEVQPTETHVIWVADGGGFAIIPQGQHPADTVAQLRNEISQRAEEQRLAAAFQAAIADNPEAGR
ncbi:hypothetical protein AB0E11_27575 [Streptomyces fradiae]|uniref:hypothetical protein n=1 Tax=Streptomyces fradiae TaxID=1906 RepID=UPI002943945A|nr:hypothetical protein [Streptomyces fradiae]WOI58638.1 hypothetical protein RYQ63_01060 [Streptomyces fradiae]